MTEAIRITHAGDADVQKIWRLAALDDRRAPRAGSWTARRWRTRSIPRRTSSRCSDSRRGTRRWRHERGSQLGGGNQRDVQEFPETTSSLNRPMADSSYRDGIRALLPLMPAIVAFGASFGVLARAAGVDALAAVVMSATTFAGSAQFAVVSVLGAGGTAPAAIGAPGLPKARDPAMGS